MRKLIAVAAVLGAVGTVVAFNGGIAGGASGSTTIHVTLSQISFATLAGQQLSQNAPPPQGAGFVFNGTLKNTAGQVVGHDNVMCVFATPQGENVGELLTLSRRDELERAVLTLDGMPDVRKVMGLCRAVTGVQ